ncbi:MAG TPA: hypothetical protein VEF04_10225 [Blastocatellia bacterium]|nr:hypothetical protein [Blastocatellia bacterium]
MSEQWLLVLENEETQEHTILGCFDDEELVNAEYAKLDEAGLPVRLLEIFDVNLPIDVEDITTQGINELK